ncbi:hypothetical protein NM688_g3443 [Phlebia brevispora]|uniref:Uncharacterized protein n=1 Tax=Phlebia brevispora TaxID=194682 RepID=A0ACC1T5R5_9APHY|nr:hypothetical protein NM688_g3443 [Phlebia brevispora]
MLKTIPIGEDGLVLGYRDTGPPTQGSTYLTVVLIHGLVFHGGIFSRMEPYASSHNLRLVSVNMRDYPGSSPFTPTELNKLASADHEVQDDLIHAQAHEVAIFLERFIQVEQIPPIDDRSGIRQGGLALVGWSMGNVFSISILAHARHFHTDALEEYLRTVVIYDTPNVIIGEPPLDGVYHPMMHPMAPEERCRAFLHWCASYYEPIRDISSLDNNTVRARRALHEISDDHTRTPTITRMSPDEFSYTADNDVFQRSGQYMRNIPPQVFYRNAQRALCDTEGILPTVDVIVIWCDMSPSVAAWAAKRLKERVDTARAEGKHTRAVRVINIKDANHFVHWEDPERMVKFFAQNI